VDYQVLFNITVGLSGVLGGWMLNNITRSINLLDKDVREMPRIYITKEDYRRDIDEIKDICRQIFAKLDNKADK
jgi:hypothetical protein